MSRMYRNLKYTKQYSYKYDRLGVVLYVFTIWFILLIIALLYIYSTEMLVEMFIPLINRMIL